MSATFLAKQDPTYGPARKRVEPGGVGRRRPTGSPQPRLLGHGNSGHGRTTAGCADGQQIIGSLQRGSEGRSEHGECEARLPFTTHTWPLDG